MRPSDVSASSEKSKPSEQLKLAVARALAITSAGEVGREAQQGRARAGRRKDQSPVMPHPDVAASRTVEILPGTAFNAEPVHWLWRDWLALGKLHILAGAPGTGKTTIALSLAAAITTGRAWPDGSANQVGDVLIWSGEDGVSDTLLPRLLAAGGDPARIHFVNATCESGKLRPFDPATDMPKLAEAARALPDLRLMILDPVVSAVTGDSHKNTETRRGLQPVVDLAEELNCAMLGLTHLSKGTSGRDPLERVAGSIAFGAVARLVWVTVKPIDVDVDRRLVRAKSNLGPDSGGFEYALGPAMVPGCDFPAQRVVWGNALEGSPRDLMAVEEPDQGNGAVEEAEEFLADTLKDGPLKVRDIESERKARGEPSAAAMKRAKKAMGIVTRKVGFDQEAHWVWELPAPTKTLGDDGRGSYE